jgi:hypothetical protein
VAANIPIDAGSGTTGPRTVPPGRFSKSVESVAKVDDTGTVPTARLGLNSISKVGRKDVGDKSPTPSCG